MKAKTTAMKTTATKKPAARKAAKKAMPAYGPRADFGKPIDGFFAKQPPPIREITVALRSLVSASVPKATASLKWGMPVYEIEGGMVCAIGAHKAHVNLILSGPKEVFADPKGLLDGTGKSGRRLTLRPGDTIPEAAVRGWLKAAAKNAAQRG